jgi:DNA processing protein
MSDHSNAVPDVAYAVALASLEEMTPVRLSRLLRDRVAEDVYRELLADSPSLAEPLQDLPSFGSRRTSDRDRDPTRLPAEASWGATGSVTEALDRRGNVLATLRNWADQATRTSVAERWGRLGDAGIGAVRRGEPGYPSRMLRAQTAPEVLYFKGSLDHAAAPSVGIVGTRKATPYGRSTAVELGRELAARGVVVVSGLAAGIDAAAHWGVLQAPGRPHGPLAVVGGGVDVVYPPANRELWAEVERSGGLMSDAPPGAAPEPWRFPLRNRLIAAMSQVLVVVESTRKGGAMHTVQAADAIGVPVLAVPGSVRSPQSEGTNAIIQAGARVALDVHDVLVALEMESIGTVPPAEDRTSTKESPRKPALSSCTPDELKVFEAVEDTPTTTEFICQASKLDLGVVALSLDRLEELGLVSAVGPDWCRA